MLLTISFVGAHGSGKTTTARRAVKDGFRMQSVEAIDLAFGLPPVERQTLFFTAYVNSFLSALNTTEPGVLVFDSHPLVVLPYTEYWLSRGGLDRDRVDQVLEAFGSIIALLPPVDLMVYLEADDIDVLVERVKRRARFSVAEEARADYIEFVDRKLRDYLQRLGPSLARYTLTVKASLELEERYGLVKEWLDKHWAELEVRKKPVLSEGPIVLNE